MVSVLFLEYGKNGKNFGVSCSSSFGSVIPEQLVACV